MAPPLYTLDLLRLTAETPAWPRLAAPMASLERRAHPCGSRILLDVSLDAEGRIAALGMSITACAFGQASAALLVKAAMGRDVADLDAAAAALTCWLAGDAEMPDWPGLAVLAPALPYSARHPAIRLPFETAAAVVRAAREARAA